MNTKEFEQRMVKQIERLHAIAKDDAVKVHEKDYDYKQSWQKRGGVGAFFVICRKWDRLEARVESVIYDVNLDDGSTLACQYDIFNHVKVDSRDEGIIDDIRDLRRYLLVLEEELQHRGTLPDILTQDVKRFPDVELTGPTRGPTHEYGSTGTHEYGSTGMKHPFGYDPNKDK